MRRQHTLADLALASMATKRQTTDAVEQLSWSGVVRIDRARQPHRVQLAVRDDLAQLVGPLPETSPDWGPLLRLVAGLVEASGSVQDLAGELQSAQLHRALRQHEAQFARVDVQPPGSDPAETFGERVAQWIEALLGRLAAGSTP
jgi:hypothetical protein